MIKYKNESKWAFIKSYLSNMFESLTTSSNLQIQLNSNISKWDYLHEQAVYPTDNSYFSLLNLTFLTFFCYNFGTQMCTTDDS